MKMNYLTPVRHAGRVDDRPPALAFANNLHATSRRALVCHGLSAGDVFTVVTPQPLAVLLFWGIG